jgi:hypothetical protein
MDRTFFGYRKQCAPLLVGELTQEPNLLRATANATWEPWSASTNARHRSIPAVTPADVKNGGSATNMASGSSCTELFNIDYQIR